MDPSSSNKSPKKGKSQPDKTTKDLLQTQQSLTDKQQIGNGRETRGIKLDVSKLGDKITMSSATCHKCKVTIPLNQMNICSGKKVQVPMTLNHQASSGSQASLNKR